jgi:hypothetical protein
VRVKKKYPLTLTREGEREISCERIKVENEKIYF